jgi:hypothetical protein
MQKLNDLSRSLAPLEPDGTLDGIVSIAPLTVAAQPAKFDQHFPVGLWDSRCGTGWRHIVDPSNRPCAR